MQYKYGAVDLHKRRVIYFAFKGAGWFDRWIPHTCQITPTWDLLRHAEAVVKVTDAKFRTNTQQGCQYMDALSLMLSTAYF